MGEQSARIGLKWLARVGAPLALSLLLANCSGGGDRIRNTNYSPRVVNEGEQVPKGGGRYKVGNPYTINGRTYYPEHNPSYRSEGIASWYGRDFHGRRTANGEVYDMEGISAAHPTMPMPSYARVTNLENGRSIIVRVNDRGPYARNRIIDLSTGAAKALGTQGRGLARVRVEYVGRAGLAGSDDQALLASLRHGTPAPAPANVRVARAPNADDDRAAEARAAVPRSPVRRAPSVDDDRDAAPRRPARPAPSLVRATPLPSTPTPSRTPPDYSGAITEPGATPAERAGALGLMSGRGLY